jgi:hypothetical protein
MFRGLEGQRERFGVGRGLVFAAELFDARLQVFAGAAAAVAKDRAEVAVVRGIAGILFDVRAAGRNGDVGAETKLAAGRIREDKEATAQFLAGEFEENLGGLQNGRFDARITRALVELHECVGASVLAVLVACRHGAGL